MQPFGEQVSGDEVDIAAEIHALYSLSFIGLMSSSLLI
jgi:hypothetical protein